MGLSCLTLFDFFCKKGSSLYHSKATPIRRRFISDTRYRIFRNFRSLSIPYARQLILNRKSNTAACRNQMRARNVRLYFDATILHHICITYKQVHKILLEKGLKKQGSILIALKC